MAYILRCDACSMTEAQHKLLMKMIGVHKESKKLTKHDYKAFINKDENRN